MESVTDAGGPVLLASTAPDLCRGDVLAGRYQIEAVIGNGGSGRVLRAFDRVARTAVALKILRREFAADPVWTERFSRELRVGRQIQNPHVCRVFDIGEADGNRFLSMELATGGTIRAQLGKEAPVRSLDDRVADARAIIEGVAAIHAAGIVHRDIKPENILRMEDGRLIVSDFGLATDPGSGPATTVMVGTPTYMAPEVVMGDPATMRSDVWAVGVVLHEILFGRRPERTAASRGIRRYTPPDVAEVKERRLAELCGRCSDDAAEERPASAVEVLRELEFALQGRRRVAPRTRRHQLIWGAVALVSLAALGLIRNRWINRAAASSSQVVGSIANQVLQPTGTPEDWSKGATKLASFAGRLHCFSLVDSRRKVRAIWGTPRRAEDIDVATGARSAANLLAEAYADGCPQISPNGKRLLFEKSSDSGSHLFLAPSPDGQNARQIASGSAPEWLPNGEEFAFALDSRHAAIFAISTGEMTVVTDGESKPRQLGESVVDPSGTRLAIRYTTEAPDNLIVVHALPSLEVLERMRLPVSAQRLRFSSTGELLFTLNGPRGFALLASSSSRRAQSITSVGEIPRGDVNGTLELGDGLIVVGHSQRKNLWVDEGGTLSALTTDGDSIHGSLSAAGDLVIQRRLGDGRLAMVLRSKVGAEEQFSAGPLDVTPSFLPDGRGWLYAKLDGGQIVECSVVTGKCASIHSDPLIPGFPSPAPSGSQFAYLTLINGPRIRIVSRTGDHQRDLGPAGGDACPPFWSAEDRLWVARSPVGSEIVWAEFDTETGQRTGAESTAQNAPGKECTIPSTILARRTGPRPREVFVVSEETSELIRTAAGRPAF